MAFRRLQVVRRPIIETEACGLQREGWRRVKAQVAIENKALGRSSNLGVCVL
jgi:hypothetical protein